MIEAMEELAVAIAIGCGAAGLFIFVACCYLLYKKKKYDMWVQDKLKEETNGIKSKEG